MRVSKIYDPYQTGYGATIGMTETKRIVGSYVMLSEPLNYEYSNIDNVRIFFITGHSEEELALPLFEHPLILEDRTKPGYPKIVACDLRRCVSKHTVKPLNLSDVINKTEIADYQIIRTLLTAELVAGNFGTVFKQSYQALALSFSSYINSLILRSFQTLPFDDQLAIKIVAAHYILSKTYPNDDISDITITNEIIQKITNTKISVYRPEYIREVVAKLKPDPLTIDDLVTNIKAGVSEETSGFIIKQGLINNISRTWVIGDGDLTTKIALENPVTWLGQVFTTLSHKTYSVFGIGKFIYDNKKIIDPHELFVKNIRIYLEQHKK